MTPIFFATPAAWRRWLSAHHAHERELIVGFHKRHSGTPSITWPESVDEALCFGWIDGIRRRLDDDTYTIRFTPRRRGSTWSAVNVKRVGELIRLRRMRAAGLRAFKARTAKKTAIYSFEQRKSAVLSRAQQQLFKAPVHVAYRSFTQRAPDWRPRQTFAQGPTRVQLSPTSRLSNSHPSSR